MKQFISFMIMALLLWSCSSPELPPPKPFQRVKVEYKDVPLQTIVDKELWIGGTRDFPVYFTAQGARIYTPLKGVVQPKTTRTVHNRKVIYPAMGYQLIGDMQVSHFTTLVKTFEKNLKKEVDPRPPVLIADSNRLDKGAVVEDSLGREFLKLKFINGEWHIK